MQEITAALKPALAKFAARYPGETGRRQPVHTVYGGAHLFKSDTAPRLGALALRSFETYAPDAEAFAETLGLPEKLSDFDLRARARKARARAGRRFSHRF